MTTLTKKDKQITVSLDSFITLILGSEQLGSRELPSYELGLILDALVKKDLLFKVQFESWEGKPLSKPVLWSYSEWYNSSTNWKLQKANSDKRRDDYHIFQANHKILVDQLVEKVSLPPEVASATAFHWLSKKMYGKIRALIGTTKLIEKVEEIV
jgi:hypothetical protein